MRKNHPAGEDILQNLAKAVKGVLPVVLRISEPIANRKSGMESFGTISVSESDRKYSSISGVIFCCRESSFKAAFL